MTIKALWDLVTGIFDMVPGWLYAAVLAAFALFHCSTVSTLEGERDAVQLKLSKNIAQTAADTAERERVAREDAQQVARDQFRHSERQQEITNDNAKRTAIRIAADRATADDTRVLRDIVRGYTNAGGSGGKDQADAAQCGRDDDRPRRLGALVEEALELSRESEGFIRQRDDEVKRLLDQIATDRAAVAGDAK